MRFARLSFLRAAQTCLTCTLTLRKKKALAEEEAQEAGAVDAKALTALRDVAGADLAAAAMMWLAVRAEEEEREEADVALTAGMTALRATTAAQECMCPPQETGPALTRNLLERQKPFNLS